MCCMSVPVFLHVDLDAFYASVEQLDHPELRGTPVIVGGHVSGRGVVSACSYEARVYGVHSAMPAGEARRRCPHAHFLPVRMQRYQQISSRIMERLAEFAPEMQQISVDEAFLNLSGTQRLLGNPDTVGEAIRHEIRESHGLTASIGIGPSRFIAKMASDYDKPDGMHIVPSGGEAEFVRSLPLKRLWGVGGKTLRRLTALGIGTVTALRDTPQPFLRGHFGQAGGAYLYRVARGLDPGIYAGAGKSHSISSETTFDEDTANLHMLRATLLDLCEQVMFRAFHSGGQSRTITLKLRKSDFSTMTLQRTCREEIGSTDELFGMACELLKERWDGSPLRLLGVGLGNVQENACATQQELFSEIGEQTRKRRRVEKAVFQLRERGATIHKAGRIESEITSETAHEKQIPFPQSPEKSSDTPFGE